MNLELDQPVEGKTAWSARSGKNPAKLRVLQVGKFYPPHMGGIETHLHALCGALRHHADVRVLVSSEGRNTREEVIDSVPVARLGTLLTAFSTSISPGMVSRIRHSNADLVHIHLPNPTAVLAYLASGHRGRLVITYHSDTVKQKVLGRMFEPFLNAVLRKSDAIIATSPNYLATSPALQVFRDRCQIIPYGIDTAQFAQCSPEVVRKVREQFGERLVVSVGRLVYYKGFEVLIRAMASVRGKLLIVGDGPLRSELRMLSSQLGVTDKVVFAGEIDNAAVTSYYHAADLFALASVARSEAFGIVQIEAMAAGLPVINTALDSGVPFVSLDGETGLTVKPGDPQALAAAINRLLDDDGLRQSFGQAGICRARDEFGLDIMVRRTLQLYESVIGRDQRGLAMSPSVGTTKPPNLSSEQNLAAPSGTAEHTEPAVGWFKGQIRVVWALVLLFAASFVWFYPTALTNYDEVSYVRQAVSFVSGSATVDAVDPFTGQHQRVHPSDYPPGTSTLMAPLVWLAGWRGAFVLGLLALAASTLFTARWIADSGGSPLYALVLLGYVPAMVIARTGMSDVPSACLVAAGLWLFWADNQSPPWRRLAAGFLAGVSMCLREPNPVLFVFFFAGALLRRERHILALIFGGLAGLACRPLLAALVYGNPFFVKGHVYAFSGLYAKENLLMYLIALLVLVPGGLIFTMFYRGKRWIELISTVVVYIAIFIWWNYDGAGSGGLKQWILTLRFLIPVVPIVAFAMAHTCPRWYQAMARSLRPESRFTFERVSRVAVVVWVTGIVVVGFLVNWRSEEWSKLHQDVVQSLYANTDPAQPIMADLPATVKFLNELHGQRMLVDLDLGDASSQVRNYQLQRLLDRNKMVQIVLFDRDDSGYWLHKSKSDEAFISSISQQLHATLKLQRRFPGLGVLRIWDVSGRS